MLVCLPPEWVDAGTAMWWQADDYSWAYTLPFSFPFFGVSYSTIYVSSNGLMTFTGPDPRYSNSIIGLTGMIAIAVAWDDWVTWGPRDIYIWSDSSQVGIRWYASPYYDWSIVANFEAILWANGTIQFNYGYNDGAVSATIGISDGAGSILAEDVTSLNYIDTIVFIPGRYVQHELAVTLDAPSILMPGESSVLNATVHNMGLNDETGVVLSLIIDDATVASEVIPTLQSGTSYTISHTWTPSTLGTYNITAYVQPVPGEISLQNNVATKFASVQYPLISPLPGQWAYYMIELNDTSTGQLTVLEYWNLTYDYYVNPHVVHVTITQYVGGTSYTDWMTVNTMNRFGEQGLWAGWWYLGWVQTDISIGSPINLLDGLTYVNGSKVIQVGGYPVDCWQISVSSVYVFYYDKVSGLWTRLDIPAGAPYIEQFILLSTNVPLGYVDITAPSSIIDLATSKPTQDSITLTWTAPGDDGNTGTAAGYIVKYSTTGPIAAENWDSATTYSQSWTPLPAGSTETHVVSDLKNDTRYWFAVEAYDEVSNYGDISNSPSGITTDAFPPAPITDLATSNPTATSISLTWTAPGDNGTLGTATGYVVKYSTSGPIDASNWDSATTYSQSWTPQPAGSMETYEITGLSGDTTYWFAVMAFDEVPNYSDISNSPSGTTTDIVPPAAISDLAISNPTATSLTLTWTAPGDNGMQGTATGYIVKYSTKGPITAENWNCAKTYCQSWTPLAGGNTESHVVTGLRPNTKYWFAIKAYDEVPNYGSVSNSPGVRTLHRCHWWIWNHCGRNHHGILPQWHNSNVPTMDWLHINWQAGDAGISGCFQLGGRSTPRDRIKL